jgi:hypothetical protein
LGKKELHRQKERRNKSIKTKQIGEWKESKYEYNQKAKKKRDLSTHGIFCFCFCFLNILSFRSFPLFLE